MEKTIKLTVDDVEKFVKNIISRQYRLDRIDNINKIIFPKGKRNICAVGCTVVNYDGKRQYDMIFLLWKQNDTIYYRSLVNSFVDTDYIHCDGISVIKDTKVTISYLLGKELDNSGERITHGITVVI